MFEKASRAKLRFACSRGNLSVEDLWDLSLDDLDTMFRALSAKAKAATEESLLAKPTKGDIEAELKLALIRRVFEVRSAEAESAKNAKKVAEEKQKLLGILATKRAASLEALSETEIEARIAALG